MSSTPVTQNRTASALAKAATTELNWLGKLPGLKADACAHEIALHLRSKTGAADVVILGPEDRAYACASEGPLKPAHWMTKAVQPLCELDPDTSDSLQTEGRTSKLEDYGKLVETESCPDTKSVFQSLRRSEGKSMVVIWMRNGDTRFAAVILLFKTEEPTTKVLNAAQTITANSQESLYQAFVKALSATTIAQPRTSPMQFMVRASIFSSALAVLIVAAQVIPVPFTIRGEGVIEPEEYAPVRPQYSVTDGALVEKVHFVPGQRVEKGDLMFTLEDAKLQRMILETRNKIVASRGNRIKAIQMLNGDDGSLGSSEKAAARSNVVNLELELIGLKAELELYEKQQKKLFVPAPCSGLVTKPEKVEGLEGKPAKSDEALATIGNDRGEWLLNLQISNEDMEPILEAVKERDGDLHLPVNFYLDITPGVTYKGRIFAIDQESNTMRDDPSQEPCVLVRVALDESQMPFLAEGQVSSYIGAPGRGHIACGTRSAWDWIMYKPKRSLQKLKSYLY
jgi:hypothetical protein